jgi:Tfp pilus assembly protein PilF/SAM-dependent methyltransferase
MVRTPSRRDRRRAGSSRKTRKILSRAERHLYQGEGAKAVPLIEDILAADPENGGAHHLAGMLCHQSAQPGAALSHARRAIEAEPDNAGFVNGYGVILQAAGQINEAVAAFRRAVDLDPKSAQTAANLGFAQRQAGDLHGALEAFAQAVALDPTHVNAYLGWVDLLGRAKTPAYDEAIAGQLLQALCGQLSAPEELAPAIANQLRLKFSITEISDDKALDAGEPLLAAYLKRCLNIDPTLERSLTRHRRRLLNNVATWSSTDTNLAGLIARQGFINEYAFYADNGEIEAVKALEQDMPCEQASNLLAYAMYRPLSRLGQINLSSEAVGEDLTELIRLSVHDQQEENRIKTEIPSLSSIKDATSLAVRAQYEEHPYPRWTLPTPQAPMHPAMQLTSMFAHFQPPEFLTDGLSVLIAGCGTGRHVAAVAEAYPESDITAIDISLSSIAYGMRMTQALGMAENATFMQADILDAGRLDRQFEMIQSVGVLHHMKTPIDGWRVLAGLLRPGGVMKIGLYSERGRQGILRCRDIIAEEGIGSSDADMAAFRHRLMENPPQGDFAKVMQRADFYSLSMCRDLLFHVQEVCYTPARIKAELDELGLRFIGFEETEALGLNTLYRERFSDCPNLDNLDHWEALEASLDDPPEGYVFWCSKPDAP